jgi:hypothetical protein
MEDQKANQNPADRDYTLLDQELLPFAEVVHALAEIEGVVGDDQWGMKMSVEEIEIDMPLEFDIMTDENGNVVLGGAPPTQTIETSFMPVFHRVKVGIKILSEAHGGE